MEEKREGSTERIRYQAENGSPEACLKMAEIYENGIGVPVSYAFAEEWYKRYIKLVKSRHEDGSLFGAVTIMNAYFRFCEFLERRSMLSFSYVVHDEMIPYLESVMKDRKYADLEGVAFYEHADGQNEQDEQNFIFAICRTYYLSVKSDMQRDLDDRNAKKYEKGIRAWKAYVTEPARLQQIESWLSYMVSAGMVWERITQNTDPLFKKKEDTLDECLAQAKRYERELLSDPTDYDRKEALGHIYEEISHAYTKSDNAEKAVEYFDRSTALLIEYFKKSPESLLAFEILLMFNEMTEFVGSHPERHELSDILHAELEFLLYCESIGLDVLADNEKKHVIDAIASISDL